MKHFSFRRYDKDILFKIISQAAVHFDAYRRNNNDRGNKGHYVGLGHRELKRKTERALNLTFHPATFDKYLGILVDECIFIKFKRHTRGSKAEYRLTERAREEFQAGVLQIRAIAPTIEVFADEEERRRLYHLLFTIETLEPPFVEEIYDTEEGMLGRIQKLLGVSILPGDLIPHNSQIDDEVDYILTYYKPVSCLQIVKRMYSKDNHPALGADDPDDIDADTAVATATESLAKSQKQPIAAAPAFYYVKKIGFSATDVMNYERKFGFVSTHYLTKSKVKRSIRLLREARIIAPIGKVKGETRYAFADESLRQLVGSCLVIFNHTMELLLSKVWQNERKVNPQERAWLEKVYGHRQADLVISDHHHFLIDTGQKNVVKVKENYNIEKKVLYGFVKKEVEEIKQKYGGTVMQQYPFPLNYMLEDMIFPQFLEKSLGIGKTKSNAMASVHGIRR